MLERESTLELDFLSSYPSPPLPDCADLGEFFSFLEPQFPGTYHNALGTRCPDGSGPAGPLGAATP